MRGRFLERSFGGQSESWPDRGAPERLMAWWPVERWEALRLALGARGALPREVGTLIPPQRVPAGALAPPAAPPPRLGSRGTGKPRTHCAARMRNHVRHSGASRSERATRGPIATNPESRCDSAQHLWIPGSRLKKARPGMTRRGRCAVTGLNAFSIRDLISRRQLPGGRDA